MKEWGVSRWESEHVQLFGGVFPGRQMREMGQQQGSTEAFLRGTTLRMLYVRYVCMAMECSSRARNDGGSGEKGGSDRS